MMKQKRGMGAIGWILTILILIAIGVGIYFMLTGGSDGGATILNGSDSGSSILGGNSIPTPPALPN